MDTGDELGAVEEEKEEKQEKEEKEEGAEEGEGWRLLYTEGRRGRSGGGRDSPVLEAQGLCPSIGDGTGEGMLASVTPCPPAGAATAAAATEEPVDARPAIRLSRASSPCIAVAPAPAAVSVGLCPSALSSGSVGSTSTLTRAAEAASSSPVTPRANPPWKRQ